MVPHATVASTFAPAAEQSRTKRLLAELKQMSRASQREDGLLNHVQAASILDVSSRRVGELVELGKLSRFDFLGRTYVSTREVLTRREADVKAGRPPRTFRQRLATTAKTVTQIDGAQYVAEAFAPVPKKRRPKKQ
jgi:hypothetical protein